jgi:hypothetical protein
MILGNIRSTLPNSIKMRNLNTLHKSLGIGHSSWIKDKYIIDTRAIPTMVENCVILQPPALPAGKGIPVYQLDTSRNGIECSDQENNSLIRWESIPGCASRN